MMRSKWRRCDFGNSCNSDSIISKFFLPYDSSFFWMGSIGIIGWIILFLGPEMQVVGAFHHPFISLQLSPHYKNVKSSFAILNNHPLSNKRSTIHEKDENYYHPMTDRRRKIKDSSVLFLSSTVSAPPTRTDATIHIDKQRSKQLISQLKQQQGQSKDNNGGTLLNIFYQAYPQLSSFSNQNQTNSIIDARAVSTMMHLLGTNHNLSEAVTLLHQISKHCIQNINQQQQPKQNMALISSMYKSYITHIARLGGPCWVWHTSLYHYSKINTMIISDRSNHDSSASMELHHALLSSLGTRLDLIEQLIQWRNSTATTSLPIQLWENLFSPSEIQYYQQYHDNFLDHQPQNNNNNNNNNNDNNNDNDNTETTITTLPLLDRMSLQIAITAMSRNIGQYNATTEVPKAVHLACHYMTQIQQNFTTTHDPENQFSHISTYHLVLKILSKASSIRRRRKPQTDHHHHQQQQQKEQEQKQEHNYVTTALLQLWENVMPLSCQQNHGTIDIIKTYCAKEGISSDIFFTATTVESSKYKNNINHHQQQQQITWIQYLEKKVSKVVVPSESFYPIGQWIHHSSIVQTNNRNNNDSDDFNDKVQQHKSTIVMGIKPHRNAMQNGVSLVFYIQHPNKEQSSKYQYNNINSEPHNDYNTYFEGKDVIKKKKQKFKAKSNYEKLAFILLRNIVREEEMIPNNHNGITGDLQMSSLLIGMWIDPKFRGNGFGTILMGAWIQLCQEAGVHHIGTEKINKPLLALLLTKYGFTPDGGGITMEISPVSHLSSDSDKKMCQSNNNNNTQCVLYSSQNVLLNGAFDVRDLRHQNLYIAKEPPSPRGLEISLKTSYHLNSTTYNSHDFLSNVQQQFHKGAALVKDDADSNSIDYAKPIEWLSLSKDFLRTAMFGYFLQKTNTTAQQS